MNLVEYVQTKGIPLAKQSSGGEWAGPCPFCGGNDRFRVFESGGRSGVAVPGRYFCRQCEARGDFISWQIDREGMTFREAMGRDGQTDKNDFCPTLSGKSCAKGKTVAATASEKWSEQAERVLSSAWQGMSAPGAAAFFRDERGLSGATCKALGFGWNSADDFTAAELWGLDAGKKVVVPAGCVLPVRRAGRVVSLLVRRADASQWERWGKWCEVRGGSRGVPFLSGNPGGPLVVCESILCAASIFETTGGKVAALATLGASKPILDPEAVAMLTAAAVVLVAGDRDDGGEKLLPTIRNVRADAVPYSVPANWNGQAVKDINDLLTVGGADAVTGWLLHGLNSSLSAMPEAPGAGDQEHGGEVVNAEETPEEAGPDEFAAHIEQVRSAWPDGPPMIAPDMPDWSAFCVGWWRDCFQCPYYDANPASSPCALWEAAFPGAVRWYAGTF